MKGMSPKPHSYRPNPRLAFWLSILLPGAGQAYLGQLWLALILAAAWFFGTVGMLDVLTTFRGHPYRPLFGACALLLGGGAWGLGPVLARRRAERMTAHSALYRWIAQKPFLRALFMEEWPDLLLALGFAIVAVGHFNGVPWLGWIAGQVMWWWPYELLGTFFLMLYLAFWEGLAPKLVRPEHRLVLLVSLFAALAMALHLLFRLPLKALALSGLILLPSYAPVLTLGREAGRIRFLYRGGRAWASLLISLFPFALLISLLEKPGVQRSGRPIFEASAMVLWGGFYFLTKALLESLNRGAAIALGEERDPRWGGPGG
jgi:hypothetical protein